MIELTEAQADALLRLIDESTSGNWGQVAGRMVEIDVVEDLCEAVKILADECGTDPPFDKLDF